MSLVKKILFLCLFLCPGIQMVLAQHPSIGGYNVYYGDLHNHSNVSDGTGTPSSAYAYARDQARLDFFSLSDHSDFFSPPVWANMKSVANSYNQDGVYTTFYGFEWTSDGVYGHLCVINTDDYSTPDPPTENFEKFIPWLDTQPTGIAIFNHPGKENAAGLEFSHFNSAPSDKVVGIELFNRDDIYNIYYYNDGYYPNDNNKSFYDEALSRGWKIGATGDGDNHMATWGVATPYRMAILANNLTRADLLSAMQARRFYSTLDKNLALSFKINGMEMGSTLTSGTYPVLIEASDANGENFTEVVLYNKNHDIVNTWNINTPNVSLSMNLSTAGGDYYYIKIKQADGDEAISSPIWFSGGSSNQYPSCSVTSPSGGTTYNYPSNVTITAGASDPDGTISKVEFFRGSTKIGEDLTGPYSISWNNAPAGTFNITVRATDNSGATATSSPVSITINPRPITIAADPLSKIYGDPDPRLTYHITSGSLAGTDTFSGSLTRDEGESTGTYNISQGNLALNSNYTLTFFNAEFNITRRSVTVTADSKTKAYGDADPALTYRLTSGSLAEPVAFSGTLSRNTGENVGSYTITRGSLSLNSNYLLTFTGAGFSITTRPVTVTADNKTKTYGDSDPGLTFQITSGSLAGTDVFTGTLTRNPGENAGNYNILQGSLSLNSNYSLTFAGSTFSISARPVTVIADNRTKVYGDSDPALVYHITSGSLIGTDSFSGSLVRAAGENAGIYSITRGSLTPGSNYNLTFAGADFTITQRQINIKSDAATKVYGEADPQLTYKISSGNLIGTDSFTGSLTRTAGEQVGIYHISPGALSAGPNYAISFSGADFTISKRPLTITTDHSSKTYGENDPELTYRITSGTLIGSDKFTGSLARSTCENTGIYNITIGSLTPGDNYSLSYIGADLVIAPRPLTLTSEPVKKIYGEADPAFTYKILSGNLIGSDAFAGELSREAGESAGIYGISQGTLRLSNNYIITFLKQSLEITPRPVTIITDVIKKVYGEPDPALTFNITSGILIGSDKFTGALSREPGENTGNYNITEGSLTLGNNYSLSVFKSILTITQRYVTVAASDLVKVYGEADPVLTLHFISGSLAGNDEFSGKLLRMPGEDAGSYEITRGSLELNENYIFIFEPGHLEISQRPVTVTAKAKKKVLGEADPVLTWLITSGSLAGNDMISGTLSREPGEEVGVYSIKRGDLSLNSNYLLTFAGADFTITRSFEMKVFPNPFRDHLYFELELNKRASISLDIYNLTGSKIATVFIGIVEPDAYRFDYQSRHTENGELFYRLTIEGKVIVRGKVIHEDY